MKTKEMTISAMTAAIFVILVLAFRTQLWIAQVMAGVSFFMLSKSISFKGYLVGSLSMFILMALIDPYFLPWMLPMFVGAIIWNKNIDNDYVKVGATFVAAIPLYLVTFYALELIYGVDLFTISIELLVFTVVGESIMTVVTMYLGESLYARLNR